MVDVTLQIMLEPATHDLSYNPEKAAARFRRGDIFAGHRSTDIATLTDGAYRITEGIGTQVFGYIHITDVPVALALRAQNVLSSGTGEVRTEIRPSPIDGSDEESIDSDDWRGRRWRIPRSIMPPALLAQLLADREITVTWDQAKPRIRRKIVAVRLDVSQDDESSELTDADLA